MAIKDQPLALNSGIGLAGFFVVNFWGYKDLVFSECKDEIINSIIKPNEYTVLHCCLAFFQDIVHSLRQERRNTDDLSSFFDRVVRIAHEVNLEVELPKPKFDECNDTSGHFDCECFDTIIDWVGLIEEKSVQINNMIVHSAFHIIFQSRGFLREFHLELAKFIESNIDEIKQRHPDFVTQSDRIKRKYFPEWLKKAVYHRDKGTCTFCRCDLTHLVRIQNTKHIDHIVPLALFGSNDASNFQLLCEKCNTSKGARSTETSTVEVPYWNLPV
ncbi:HNH endonuclease [Bacillus cereus]|nr:HNH endonuclease [Bacillus cereus]